MPSSPLGRIAGSVAAVGGELKPDQGRIEATLLGLAVGDALGAPFEAFWADEAAAAVERGLEMTGGGKWEPGWEPGEWTDDTAMALCLAECLGERGLPLDLDDLARRYAAWAASGPKDIGMTLRAWSLRSIACESTFEAHLQKIRPSATNERQGCSQPGSGDSCLVLPSPNSPRRPRFGVFGRRLSAADSWPA